MSRNRKLSIAAAVALSLALGELGLGSVVVVTFALVASAFALGGRTELHPRRAPRRR